MGSALSLQKRKRSRMLIDSRNLTEFAKGVQELQVFLVKFQIMILSLKS